MCARSAAASSTPAPWRPNFRRLPESLASCWSLTTQGGSCGICGNWDHSKKRNCSNPGTPVYYSQCLYPVEQLVLPHCVVFEETHSESGTNCPCFVPLSTNLGASK